MNRAYVVLSLILGLAAISWRNVQATEEAAIIPLRGNSTGKPGNKTQFESLVIAEDFLYTRFACRGKLNGLRLPIAGSCMDYYECQQGLARRLTCKPGMHFSNLGLTCLDARMVQCKPEQEPFEVNCEGLCCSRDDGLYPVKDNCVDFVVCLNYQTHRRSCGGGLHFSPENQICDIPERARCSAKADKEVVDQPDIFGQSKPVMYNISHRVCRNHESGFTVPIFGSCNKFYLCVEGVGYLKSCGNLIFNAEKHYCDGTIRMYCPDNDADDVILDVEEYGATKPIPLPWKKPQIKPFEFDEDEEEDFDEKPRPQKRPHNKAKKPVPEVEEEEDEISNQRPHNGKKPLPPIVDDRGEEVSNAPKKEKKPSRRPEDLEEDFDTSRPNKGNKKRPASQPEIEEDGFIFGERPPHWGKRPAPEKEEDKHEFEHNKQPNGVNKRPTFVEDLEEEQKPSKYPHNKHEGDKKRPPPVEEEDLEENSIGPADSSNICADQPVGALIAMPGECAKYIRCRWDWYQRRVAEEMLCPQDMHFNAKTKHCDWPENAGCIVFSKKPVRKNDKFTKIF